MLDTLAQRIAQEFARRRAVKMRDQGLPYDIIARRMRIGERSAAAMVAEGRARAFALAYLEMMIRPSNDNAPLESQRQAR